jgi:hypothetical protein
MNCLRPKIGTDGRPAATGEMIYPQTARKDTVSNPAPGGWEGLRGTPEHSIEWQIPFDVDFMDPRPRPALHASPTGHAGWHGGRPEQPDRVPQAAASTSLTGNRRARGVLPLPIPPGPILVLGRIMQT